MKISTILDHIDSGHMALPEFQRGYVWNSEQVRGLFDSLYRRHPVGGLLVWATETASTGGSAAIHRGEGQLAAGVVKLLLDGQQRMTSLYGVIRGEPPKFFDGNARAFTGLYFHLGQEKFELYQPSKMQGDPLWVDVSGLMKGSHDGFDAFVPDEGGNPLPPEQLRRYMRRLTRLLGILDIDLHVEEVTGQDKTLDVVVEIFNRVNSGGTKLSKGDLALAKICAGWPQAREEMKAALARWKDIALFDLDWLLRCVNTVLTGKAKFQHLHEQTADQIGDGLNRAIKQIDQALNMISGRLGLDHDRVLFGRYGIPVMVHYLDRRGIPLDGQERDKLLFWFAHAGMWGRFSGSSESHIDQDLAALEDQEHGLDRMLEQLRLSRGALRVEPGHFTGWSLGARFYPVLYMLTRVGEAKDWGTGLALKKELYGSLNRLEVHHIFPKARLYAQGYKRFEVNAVANFCFLTKGTNLKISDTLPEAYFPAVEQQHPGALASQWIPLDPALWKLERYPDFLDARKQLLAEAANTFFRELLHGEKQWLEGRTRAEAKPVTVPVGGIDSEEEELQLESLNEWVAALGLPRGRMAYDLAHPETGDQEAVFDLAWPEGLQEGLSEPVAVLLNESPTVLALASARDFRFFTEVEAFKSYVRDKVLAATLAQESGTGEEAE